MSTVKEMADREAARAEAEGDEPTPAEGDEPTPAETTPAEPAAPAADEEGAAEEADEPGEQGETPNAAALPRDSLTVSDELNEKREAQAKSQAKNVERLADEYRQDVMPCPVCERVDIAPLIVSKMVAIPAEGWATLAQMGGVEPEPEHAPAEGVEMCDRCNGWGELDYPTRNPHMARQTCPKCQGNGYTLEAQDQATVTPLPPIPSIPSPQVFAPVGPMGSDQWGRPQGHPHYGLDPAAVMP